jgi:hypothetical protein
MDDTALTIEEDDPETIARGKRYLIWSAVAAGLFVVAAAFTLHVAQERHERAVMKTNRAVYATGVGADLARHLPAPY